MSGNAKQRRKARRAYERWRARTKIYLGDTLLLIDAIKAGPAVIPSVTLDSLKIEDLEPTMVTMTFTASALRAPTLPILWRPVIVFDVPDLFAVAPRDACEFGWGIALHGEDAVRALHDSMQDTAIEDAITDQNEVRFAARMRERSAAWA